MFTFSDMFRKLHALFSRAQDESKQLSLQDQKSTPEPRAGFEMTSGNETERIILSEGEPRKLTDVVLQEGQKYRLGDIMWAKVGGHPFWPSLIYYGPGTNSYYRKKGKVAMYHVQFFGPLIERAWVTEASLMPFEGKSAFDLYLEDQMEISKDKKQTKARHEVKANRKAAWDASWREAELAYPLSRDDRVQRFGRIYVDKMPKENSPGKQKSSLGSGKKSKANDLKSSIEDGLDDKRFQTFFRIEKDKYLSENPNISEDDALNHLQSLWYNMTEDECGKYSESPPARRNRSSHPKVRKSTHTPPKEAPKRSISATSNSTSPSSSIRSPPAKRRISEINDEVHSRPSFSYYPPSPSDKSDCASITVEEDDCGIADDSDENESPTYEFQRLHKSTPRGRCMEPVCNVCEDSTNVKLLLCTGGCGFYYHLKCLLRNSTVTAADFKCHHCMENRIICFHCNEKVIDDGITCSVLSCGKTFHEKCSASLPFSKRGAKLICPAHLCHACAIDDPSSSKARKGRLVRCLRCPVAYHAGELCLAAGSAELSATYIICPRHFEIENRVNKPINVSWCFKCAKGNDLLNCSRCPASYHRDCLTPPPETDNSSRFMCHACLLGKQPRYGEIVWVKIGHFRWWPCEVLHPRDAPLNIQRLTHQKGMFPVHFFGSDEYYWLTKSRMFSFEFTEGSDRENLSIRVDSGTNKKLSAWFQAGLIVAQEGYVAWRKHLLDSLNGGVQTTRLNDSSNVESCKEDTDVDAQSRSSDQETRPAPYKFTKCNFPIGGVKIYSIDVGELPRCECRPKTAPCRSDCLNRMLMYECHPDVCPCGDLCENQRFTKKQYPQQEVFKSPDRGWALRTLVDIQKGEFVNEYVGDLVDEEEARARLEHSRVRSETNYYMITLDKGRIIDAGPRGNFSRFMNHSCNPNLETQKWMVHGDLRIGLFAVRDIFAGEELTFNYNFQSVYGVGDGIPCRCRSTNCSGFLGVRPRSRPASEAGGVSLGVSNTLNSTDFTKSNSHDVECYRCGDAGELITCEMPECRKSYHLFCLGLKKPPWGRWHCPWHHCDVCGVVSDSKCSKCPNSYCSVHLQGNILDCREDVICRDHAEDCAS